MQLSLKQFSTKTPMVVDLLFQNLRDANNRICADISYLRCHGCFLICYYRFYWILVIAAVLIAVIYVIVDVAIKSPRNLISAAGMATLILLCYIFSHNPGKVIKGFITWRICY